MTGKKYDMSNPYFQSQSPYKLTHLQFFLQELCSSVYINSLLVVIVGNTLMCYSSGSTGHSLWAGTSHGFHVCSLSYCNVIVQWFPTWDCKVIAERQRHSKYRECLCVKSKRLSESLKQPLRCLQKQCCSQTKGVQLTE